MWPKRTSICGCLPDNLYLPNPVYVFVFTVNVPGSVIAKSVLTRLRTGRSSVRLPAGARYFPIL